MIAAMSAVENDAMALRFDDFLLAHMKPGDIVTHCYHGRAHGIMGQEKRGSVGSGI